MTHRRGNVFLCVAAAILSIPLSSPAFAGAWTQPKGKLQTITTANAYQTNSYYDNSGKKVSQPSYRKLEANPYIEYGWNDTLTLGANISLQHADNSASTNYGIGDTDLFLRQRLWKNDRYVLSLQPLVKIPGPYESTGNPHVNSAHADVGAGLLGGTSFEFLGRNHYADLSVTYRHRLGPSADQLVTAATVGLNIDERWTIMPQVFYTARMDSTAATAFTQSTQDDYDLLKPQISALYKLNRDIHLQAGAFVHATGKNVGAGQGIFFAVWHDF